MQGAQEATDTHQDTTSLPQYHEHARVSYLREMALGAPCCPVLTSKPHCARRGEEGPHRGALGLPLHHSWGINTTHLGHAAGGNLELLRGPHCLYIIHILATSVSIKDTSKSTYLGFFKTHGQKVNKIHNMQIISQPSRKHFKQLLQSKLHMSPSTSRLRSLKESKHWWDSIIYYHC